MTKKDNYFKKVGGILQKFKRLLCIGLIFIIAVCTCQITVFAESKTANIVGSNVAIRTKPSISGSQVIIRVSNVTVTVNSKTTGDTVTAEGQSSNIWYNVTYGDKTGYVSGIYVAFAPEYEYDEDFEENLQKFPESYRPALRKLHAKYPNWQFVAHDVNMSFKDAVEAQYGVNDVTETRKWVEFAFGGNEWRDERAYDKENGEWITLEGRWTYASRAAIENYMDPRTSLSEKWIFAFMQQSYDENQQTADNLKLVIKGTFLENGYDVDGDGTIKDDEVNAYVNDILEAAKKSGVNPYVLAATIIVEQGDKGTSSLISGKYSGYEGYYNFFNVGAYGSNVVKSGLEYAKKVGWNSRKAAIIGGAEFYADGYISVGQDTYYYKDFNVVNKKWNHQYATALYDAWTNASRLSKGCMTNPNAQYTFIIPIYSDMPQNPCPTPTSGTWKQGSKGWWYAYSDGTYAISWKQIDDVWYYFDKDGWMQTGWQEIKDKWYYFNSSGAMQTGWQDIKGKRYYLNADGEMQIGWQKIDAKKYYFDQNGAMVTSWQQIDGERYYFDENGILKISWLLLDDKWYYLDASGVMQTGWQKIKGIKYYFDADGVMATAWQQIDDERYYFDDDGAMLSGWLKLENIWYYFNTDGKMQTDWQKINQKWYYFDTEGKMLIGWQEIDGVWYYLNSSGAMLTGWQKLGKTWFYFNSSGAMQTDWQKINQKWYYFDVDGKMQTGWQKIDGVWYYLNSSGAMLTGTHTIGGKVYHFDNSGAWIK